MAYRTTDTRVLLVRYVGYTSYTNMHITIEHSSSTVFYFNKIYFNEILIKTILNRNIIVVKEWKIIRSIKVHGIWLLNISSVIFVRVSFAANFFDIYSKSFCPVEKYCISCYIKYDQDNNMFTMAAILSIF